MIANNALLLKDINLSREEFGKYFRLIQFAYENKIKGYYCYNLFQNIISKVKSKEKYSYLQFFVCLQVFKELEIIVVSENDDEIQKITSKKSPLNASAFYNRLNTIKIGKK